MAVSTKNLVPSQFLPNVATALYTAPVTAMITAINATNTSSDYRSVTVYMVPSGASAGGLNTAVDERQLAPGESYQFPEVQGHVLDAGDALHALCSAASSVTINVSGVEIT
jgi:hypothetical protein